MTGLVYESVWTQYLKILTGHAATSQSVILVLFLSGMAIGAWMGGKILNKVKNLLVVYALIETGIGVLALIFHSVFYQANHVLHEILYPSFSQALVDPLKWLFAALLTLPQTILLGSTFPVLAQALTQTNPERKEKVVSHLYFINSIGASVGVLISGFYLSEVFGLSGTMKISGIANLLIAGLSFIVVIILKNHRTIVDNIFIDQHEQKYHSLPALRLQNQTFSYFILFAAFFSGATSFVYEIGWIRMLSMTLGSSTHAFDLMLSAFILGLALGSIWIKFRIKKVKNILNYFAATQILMGVLAILSILGYNIAFDLMEWMMESLQRNENGYLLFITGSHLVALLVMLPATIFAGMSLPLMILLMQQIDFKEDVVGKIYAIDTAGGIIGVLAAIHLMLPFFGLKYLLIIAGSLDILLGMVFYFLQTKVRLSRILIPAYTGFTFFIIISIIFLNPNAQKMASGVFRYGKIGYSKDIAFEKDGKTASIAVFKTQKGNIVLTTNGKPDASVNIYRQITGDEATQVLLAALPFSFDFRPEKVGIIGLGCGKTAHTTLTNFNIKQVDVVEIELVVYEASYYFKDYVGNIFNDSRFNLHIDDARTFFSSTKNKYDLIISEPSNPWVSGIGSLFSKEFYGLISKKMDEEGLFVQWIQTYEMTVPLIASVAKAMSPYFNDYKVFFMDDGDMAFIGKKSGKLNASYSEIFGNEELRYELSRLGIGSKDDFEIRVIGNKEILDPFFCSYPVSANSDFYPFLEYQAAKAGFLEFSASNLDQLITYPAPIISSLMKADLPDGKQVGMNPPYQIATNFKNAEALFSFFNDLKSDQRPDYKNLNQESILLINTIRQIEFKSDSLNFLISWSPFLSTFARGIMPYLPGEKLDVIWNYIKTADGFEFLPVNSQKQIHFYQEVGNQDYERIIQLSNQISFDNISLTFPDIEYYFTCRLWAFLMLSRTEEAMKLWEIYPNQSDPPMMLRLLGNLIEKRNEEPKNLISN